MAGLRKRMWKTKNGLTKSTWEYSFYHNGKQYRKGGFDKKQDAEEAKNKHLNDLEKNINNNKKVTFREATTNFMNLHAAMYCKDSTLFSYNSNLKNHLVPFFADIKMVDINTDLINQFMKQKIDEGLANKTINHNLTLLHSIIQKLVDADQLVSNPVAKVRKLKLPYNEMKFLTHEEVLTLLETCENFYNSFYPLLYTAVFTGMRKGELLALTWDDINFFTKKININKAVYRSKITTPKSDKSIRKIDIPNRLIKALKEWRIRCPHSDHNLVFPNKEGNHLDPDNMIKRKFGPCLRKAGVEKIRFHDLRHTYASMLIAQNVPVKYIQAQMGHSSIQVTMDRYGHLMPEVGEAAVKVLDDVIKNKEVKNAPKIRESEA